MSVPVSPLFSVTTRPVAATRAKANTQTLSNTEANKDRTKSTKSTLSQQVPHSGHQSERSKHYHARVVGTDQQRIVDKLNPTETIAQSRRYPGL